jgi:LPS-assembly lipoprotein
MSSSDRGRPFRPLGSMIFAATAMMALAACTVQPLYGPSMSGKLTTATLSGIAIDEVSTRVAQEVRNTLLYDFATGTSAATYRMTLNVTSAESALGVTGVETAPAYAVTVSATYAITSNATGEIVLRGTSRGTASYDRNNQLYANSRAHLDAENRAAVLAADDIRIRLSAAAAKGTL